MSLLQGLALFCGIYFASLGWAQPTGHVPANMRAAIKELKDHFHDYHKTKKSKSLFLKNETAFENLQDGEKNLLIGEMLRVSQEILSNLKNHTTDEKTRMNIHAIMGLVEEKQEDFPALKQDVQRRLTDLWDIKADEFQTQLEVLRDLMPLYSKVVVQQVMKKRRRRRRQVLRSKAAQQL